MKASFFKRIGAFLIDYLIISFVMSLITLGFNNDNSDIMTKLNNVVNDYTNKKITIEEYNDKVMELNYDLQKDNVWINGISAAMYVGYFIIFAYLNKGQTLGKKFLKIRTVGKDDKPVTFVNMLVRSLFIYGILSSAYAAIFVNFLGAKSFNTGSVIVSYIEMPILLISFFMILYRKDRKGLHDLMAGTSVIGEVK